MAHEIVVPRLGWSMDEGTFVEWLKKEGEWVNAGEMLFILEGEKAAQEIESFDAGILRIPPDAPKAGDVVEVGQRLAYLVAKGESAPFEKKSPPAADRADDKADVAPATSAAQEPSLARSAPSVSAPNISAEASGFSRAPSSQVRSTPRARRMAQRLNVDWRALDGSGRGGRVRERDVIAASKTEATASAACVASALTALSQQPAASAGREWRPVSKLRRSIAQRMLAGVQQTAPVTLTTKVRAEAIHAMRRRVRPSSPISVSDVLLKLTATTLAEHPDMNACWSDDGIVTFRDVHLAFAVDTPSGLVAPVLRHADRLSLSEIAEQTRALAERARTGRLTESDLHGGTFTVTNLGMFGIDAFTPIINLPQTAILGIGRIVREPVVDGDRIVPGETITLSLTFDHRAIDGAPAARWLQHLSHRIESAVDAPSDH